ncbi:hypothetical protein F5880DRAFT_1706100 [Lentinula raphanica]|nr:hypothetical protein F5880DRAFT_1706100 [Lentinula raphanica]
MPTILASSFFSLLCFSSLYLLSSLPTTYAAPAPDFQRGSTAVRNPVIYEPPYRAPGSNVYYPVASSHGHHVQPNIVDVAPGGRGQPYGSHYDHVPLSSSYYASGDVDASYQSHGSYHGGRLDAHHESTPIVGQNVAHEPQFLDLDELHSGLGISVELYFSLCGTPHLYRSWMTSFYPKKISEQVKHMYFPRGKDFTRNLGTDLAIDDKGDPVGSNNGGVHTYVGKTYSESEVVIKVLPRPELTDRAYGEAIVLEDAGLYVDSGFVVRKARSKEKVWNQRTGRKEYIEKQVTFPAILIKRIAGAPLKQTRQWITASRAEEDALNAQSLSLVKELVKKFYIAHGWVPTDLNQDNINYIFESTSRKLKTPRIKSASFVDLGFPSVVTVAPGTRWSEIEKWVDDVWPYWAPAYPSSGNASRPSSPNASPYFQNESICPESLLLSLSPETLPVIS